jgi:hypothetical protein
VLIATTTMYSLDGTSPWRLVHAYFPGAQAIRAVARASIVYMLGIAVAMAALLHAMSKNARVAWMAIPLGLVLVLEQGYETPAFSKEDNRHDLAEIVKAIEPGCQVFVMSPVMAYGPYWKYQNDALWAALEAHIPTMNGYAGQNPPDWGLGDPTLRTPYDDQRILSAAQAWVQKNPKLQQMKPCWVRVGFSEGPCPGCARIFGADFVSQQVPQAMDAGKTYEVELVFKNIGPRSWPMGSAIRLGSQLPQDGAQWGLTRVELPHAVEVGETAEFRFTVTAPTQPGPHAFQWRMVADGQQWLGALSKMIVVDVQPAAESISSSGDAGP